MPLRTEVGLGSGDILLDGDPAPPPKKGGTASLTYRPIHCGERLDGSRYIGRDVDLGPGHIVLDGDPVPPESGTAAPTLFSVHVYCDQTVAHLSY